MKLKNKLIFGITSLSAIALPVTLLASCSSPSSETQTPPIENSPSEKPNPGDGDQNNKPPLQQSTPTISKDAVSKEAINFEGTVQDNLYKINKQWILENKSSLLNGDTSLIVSIDDILNYNATPSMDDESLILLSFEIAPNKTYNSSGELNSNQASFNVTLNNFIALERTTETLTKLFLNYVSPYITTKALKVTENKAINIGNDVSLDSQANAINEWIKNTLGEGRSRTGVAADIPRTFYLTGGWHSGNDSLEVQSMSKFLNWNKTQIPDVFKYVNDLLTSFKYISGDLHLGNLYLYTKLDDNTPPADANNVINVNIKPLGWGMIIRNASDQRITNLNGAVIRDWGDAILGTMDENTHNFQLPLKTSSDTSNIGAEIAI